MALNKLIKFFKKDNKKKNNPKEVNKKEVKSKTEKNPKKIKPANKAGRTSQKAIEKEKLVAEVIHYFSKINVAILKMKGALGINDDIHIKGYTTDFVQKVLSIQINHRTIKTAKKPQEIGLLVKEKVRHKDKVYKIYTE